MEDLTKPLIDKTGSEESQYTTRQSVRKHLQDVDDTDTDGGSAFGQNFESKQIIASSKRKIEAHNDFSDPEPNEFELNN